MSRLQEIATNAEGFAFDPRTGESYRLNSSGRFLFQCLQAGMSVDEAAAALAKKYGVPEATALEDVQDFLLQIRLQGLISP